ncbi:MAG: 50S ribosomal protein L28 [Candidatus Omnitrophica bacterium]|nr:50S ribosomal protein L28 [Candidatus Omnitrophota bacterium]
MSRRCEICGKAPQTGKNIARRGMAKKKGGAGRKITGTSHRRFLPNLKCIRAVINGRTRRVKVCTECLKKGKVIKAV